MVVENNAATQVGPQLITQDLGTRPGYQAQFVGVVIDDDDGDSFYDIGEGPGGGIDPAAAAGRWELHHHELELGRRSN